VAEKASQIPGSLIEILSSTQSVAVLTGAGISAESGVPTFRDAQTGLWEKYQPEELATPEAFRQNPELVWEWYEWRRGLISNSKPNPGHYALVEMEMHFPKFTLITQNVDGLHERAGSGAHSPVIELHGNIFRNKCSEENRIVYDLPETGEVPPVCPHCGSYLRPDVVWFGETLPLHALEAAWGAAQSSRVFFSVGTSTVVEPAASLPFMASRARAVVVEINPNRTPLSKAANYHLQGPSGEILSSLVKLLWSS
jgi:NAD-dependent deacetylase